VQIDLKTMEVEQRRQSYAHLARRFGDNRPASRYEEAAYDIQADVHFHYRPTWQQQYEIFDTARTGVVMEDWYKLTDPRQYYYATYNIARSKQNEAVERTFEFVENSNLMRTVTDEQKDALLATLVPLRHYEWGANANNAGFTFYGYGTALTQATCFAMADRLGLAQHLSKVGLALSGNDGAVLDAGKEAWLTAPQWQPLRRLVEDSFVIEDWFEAFVAQNLCMDALVHGVAFDVILAEASANGAAPVAMLCDFVTEMRKELTRWVDHVIKTAAAESDANKALIAGWVETYKGRAAEAARAIAEQAAPGRGDEITAAVTAELNQRLAKIGLN
jgi:phenol hydroxylase P1 protein